MDSFNQAKLFECTRKHSFSTSRILVKFYQQIQCQVTVCVCVCSLGKVVCTASSLTKIKLLSHESHRNLQEQVSYPHSLHISSYSCGNFKASKRIRKIEKYIYYFVYFALLGNLWFKSLKYYRGVLIQDQVLWSYKVSGLYYF